MSLDKFHKLKRNFLNFVLLEKFRKLFIFLRFFQPQRVLFITFLNVCTESFFYLFSNKTQQLLEIHLYTVISLTISPIHNGVQMTRLFNEDWQANAPLHFAK